jgi:hypothetical protein
MYGLLGLCLVLPFFGCGSTTITQGDGGANCGSVQWKKGAGGVCDPDGPKFDAAVLNVTTQAFYCNELLDACGAGSWCGMYPDAPTCPHDASTEQATEQ